MQSYISPVVSATPEMQSIKPKVYAVILDLDGCLISSEMFFKDGDLQLLDSVSELLNHIKNFAAELKPAHFVVMNGSEYQSYAMDLARKRHNNLDGFSVMEFVYRYFKKNLQDLEMKSCRLNKYLVADNYHGTADGLSAFAMAQQEQARLSNDIAKKLLKEYKIPNISFPVLHPTIVGDASKITLMYAWLHQLAAQSKYRDHEIIVNFYDNELLILAGINSFFKRYKNLIPSNVTLKLFTYQSVANDNPIEYDTIPGLGIIDTNIKENFLNMLFCCYGDRADKPIKINSSILANMLSAAPGPARIPLTVNSRNFLYHDFLALRKAHRIYDPCRSAKRHFELLRSGFQSQLSVNSFNLRTKCIDSDKVIFLTYIKKYQLTDDVLALEMLCELLACLDLYINEMVKHKHSSVAQYACFLVDKLEKYAVEHKDVALVQISFAASSIIKRNIEILDYKPKPVAQVALFDIQDCAITTTMSVDEKGKLHGLDKAKGLLDHVVQSVNELKPNYYISMNGSNLQSIFLDEKNKKSNPPYFSSFPILEEMHNYVHKKLKSLSNTDRRLNKYLTADSYSINDLSEFKLALWFADETGAQQSLNEEKVVNKLIATLQPKAIFDRNKISIMYACMHQLASHSKFKDCEIIMDCYGGKSAVSSAVYKFYKKYPALIPSNVVLRFFPNAFVGKSTTVPFKMLLGRDGIIDTNYHENLLYLSLYGRVRLKGANYKEPMSRLRLANLLFGCAQSKAEFHMDIDDFNCDKFIETRQKNLIPNLQRRAQFIFDLLRLEVLSSCDNFCQRLLFDADILARFKKQLKGYKLPKDETYAELLSLFHCLNVYFSGVLSSHLRKLIQKHVYHLIQKLAKASKDKLFHELSSTILCLTPPPVAQKTISLCSDSVCLTAGHPSEVGLFADSAVSSASASLSSLMAGKLKAKIQSFRR